MGQSEFLHRSKSLTPLEPGRKIGEQPVTRLAPAFRSIQDNCNTNHAAWEGTGGFLTVT